MKEEDLKRRDKDDDYYMGLALTEARHAYAEGEVPIGAVVVSSSGRVLGKGYNMTEALSDVTAHAEMQAISAAAQSLGGKYLSDCTLYVTVEPCLMCAGAIGWSQMSRIVYGAADEKRGYCSYGGIKAPFHAKSTVVGGVREAECRELIQKFFKERR